MKRAEPDSISGKIKKRVRSEEALRNRWWGLGLGTSKSGGKPTLMAMNTKRFGNDHVIGEMGHVPWHW